MRRKHLCGSGELASSSSSPWNSPCPKGSFPSCPLEPSPLSNAPVPSNDRRKRVYKAPFGNQTLMDRGNRRPVLSTTQSLWTRYDTCHGSQALERLPPTTPTGADMSVQQSGFIGTWRSSHFAPLSDDDDDVQARPTRVSWRRYSLPRTPTMQSRSIASQWRESNRVDWRQKQTPEKRGHPLPDRVSLRCPVVTTYRGRIGGKFSPSSQNHKLDVLSLITATSGDSAQAPSTPEEGFDFAEFVHMTPSPTQNKRRSRGHGITHRCDDRSIL